MRQLSRRRMGLHRSKGSTTYQQGLEESCLFSWQLPRLEGGLCGFAVHSSSRLGMHVTTEPRVVPHALSIE